MKVITITLDKKIYHFIPKKLIIKTNPQYTEFIKKEKIIVSFS